ncbi:uncharacterized protein, partial [Montipora foliosa]|uniref:uncharacterized protein n=1 Tax=Montipora foliosa TaxID=591990 RepID=UPI0035F126B6
GSADGFQVRCVLSSFLFIPCWIAVLVLSAGIMGLALSTSAIHSLTLIMALRSVSMACALVSVITECIYSSAVTSLVRSKYMRSTAKLTKIKYTEQEKTMLGISHNADWRRSPFVPRTGQDAPLKLIDQENTAVAISSLVVIFSTIEISLAVCGAWSSDPPYQSPQQNQVSQAGNVPSQCAAGQTPLQPTNTAAQPMVAIPLSSYNTLQ